MILLTRNLRNFFTISILAVYSVEVNREILNAVKKTLRRKFNLKNPNKIHELKGSATVFEIKKYFYDQVRNLDFAVYSITLDKRRVLADLMRNKDRVYNFIARKVIDRVMFKNDNLKFIDLIVDRSKGKPEIEEFNSYIKRQLEAKFDPKILIKIRHIKSHESFGLQACDLFCHGIFTAYEYSKLEWKEVFKEKILFDELYGKEVRAL